MNKNKHRTAIISSEEMSTNSYNTSEDEDEIANQDFKNSIRRKKERILRTNWNQLLVHF